MIGRWVSWVRERHGVSVLAPIVLFGWLAIAEGAAAAGGAPSWRALALGTAGAWCWFLLLRVIDDLADAGGDALRHPDRPLQRGAVAPSDLRALAGVCVLAQAAVCLLADGGRPGAVTAWWAAVLVVALAATRDFGLRRWPAVPAVALRLARSTASALPVVWWSTIGASGAGPGRTAGPLVAVALLCVVTFDLLRTSGDGGDWDGPMGASARDRLAAGLLVAVGLSAVALLAAAGAASPPAVAAVVLPACAAAWPVWGGRRAAALPALLVTVAATGGLLAGLAG